MKNEIAKKDYLRYGTERIPKYEKRFLKLFRKANSKPNIFNRILFKIHCKKRNIEFPSVLDVGEGLYVGHFFNVTINPKVKIGMNCNIHKNVTIGQENRGKRLGAPTIGDNVYLGINSVIVGNIHIGNNVLICANSFVNFDVPDNSIVFGNPGIIKHNEKATEGYIQNRV